MKERIKEKQDAYAALIGSRLDGEKEVNIVRYKEAKKIAKKVGTLANNNTYESSYQKRETTEGGKDVFKVARAKEKKTRDLGNVRYIKGDDRKVLVKDTKIRERWRSYVSKLFNGELSEHL